MKKYHILSVFIALALQACHQKDVIRPVTTVSAGADLSKFIAIGDSQTAGYANDGLYRDAQINSFPNIMAGQMALVGGGNFYQPLFDVTQANGSGYLKLLSIKTDGTPVTARVTDKLAVRGTYNGITLYAKNTGSISNFGITGISLANINDAAYGNINPYFERLLPNTPPNNTTTYLDFVTAQPFTFFSCWLGNNDVLAYATSGGSTSLPTDKDKFTQLYNQLITKLTAGGQKGVVANIPDISAIPYFNVITVDAINANIKLMNPVTGLFINARTSANVSDTTHTARRATSSDLITLNFDVTKIGQLVNTPIGLQPYGLTPAAPLENKYVLDENEISIVKEYTAAYNAAIKATADAKGLAFVDIAYYVKLGKQPQVVDGVTVSSAYIAGGIFSLDGIHLTPRGYAQEANEFIDAINMQYGTKIQKVNIGGYAAVLP